MSHPALKELKDVANLRRDIEKRSLVRLSIEGLDKAPELSDKNSKFFKDPSAFAFDRLSFFMCHTCQVIHND